MQIAHTPEKFEHLRLGRVARNDGQMRPCLAGPDFARNATRQPEVLGRLAITARELANASYELIRPIGAKSRQAWRMAPLGYRIAVIIARCADKQMVWVDALRRVALVQHPKPVGYVADIESVGNPVRVLLPCVLAERETPVSTLVARPCGLATKTALPHPALVIGAFDVEAFKPGEYRWILRQITNIVEFHRSAPWTGVKGGSSAANTPRPTNLPQPAALTQAA